MSVLELAEKLVYQLSQEGLHLAAAESCTGGMAAEYITAVSGASEVFECGIVSYANWIKEKELNVSSETLKKYGAVSSQTAVEMADGIRIKASADIGIATTGIAGPTGATAEKPVGTVYIAVSTIAGTEWKRLDLLRECGNNREKIRRAAVEQLFLLTLAKWKEISK